MATTLNAARIAAAQMPKETLNLREAAAFLGCSTQNLTGLVKRGAIPCRKCARRVFFNREALRRWTMGENFGADQKTGSLEE